MWVPRRPVRILCMALWITACSGSIAAARAPLRVPQLQQVGDITNCGPTAAAMVIAAYQGLRTKESVSRLRDRVGHWSWQNFPQRTWKLPGAGAGMTTPRILQASLTHFAEHLGFHHIVPEAVNHPHFAEALLRHRIASGHPVIALVQSGTLWDATVFGLHWVVIVQIQGDTIHYNDPGDGRRIQVSMKRFLKAWRLHPLFRNLPGLRAYAGFAAATPMGHLPMDHVAQHRPSPRQQGR